MGRTTSRSDWMTRMGALTAVPAPDWPPDEVGAARDAVERLARSARDLLAADARGVAEVAVAVAAVPDAAALARDLARIPLAADGSPEAAGDRAERFLAALAAAGPAVYVCRRVRHPGHECLFGDTGGNLCQRVLLAAHRLGERAAL